MKNNNTRTVSELRTPVRKEVATFIAKLVEEYPEILTRKTLSAIVEEETILCIAEHKEYGKSLSNAQRREYGAWAPDKQGE